MKAWVLHGINDLQLNDVPLPDPRDGEVLVQVKAAGICSSDIPRVYTTGAYHYPIILGHEFSGVTADGRRAGVFPLIPCHTCSACRAGHYETCSSYSYIGSRQNGAFSEYVAVPEWNLVPLPNNMTFEQAALLEPAAVALHAVQKIGIQEITKAAVIGNGIIGQLIGEWLSFFNIQHVEVLGRNDQSSFEHYDVCFEVVGSLGAFERCVKYTRESGRIVLVGNPTFDFNMEQKLYWQILRKQLVIHGSWNSSYPAGWKTVLANSKHLQLERFISHRYPFEELSKALHMMYSKKERYSKVLLTF